VKGRYGRELDGHGTREFRNAKAVWVGLVLQRHFWESMSSAFVMTLACLVLASASPVRPSPDVIGFGRVSQDQVDEESADLR
jgi:hypothetical protein